MLGIIPVSILHKSIAGRCRPVRVADGPTTARYRFMKNASWDVAFHHSECDFIGISLWCFTDGVNGPCADHTRDCTLELYQNLVKGLAPVNSKCIYPETVTITKPIRSIYAESPPTTMPPNSSYSTVCPKAVHLLQFVFVRMSYVAF